MSGNGLIPEYMLGEPGPKASEEPLSAQDVNKQNVVTSVLAPQKWEYLTKSGKVINLDDLGIAGWQMCGGPAQDANGHVVIYFMRPVVAL